MIEKLYWVLLNLEILKLIDYYNADKLGNKYIFKDTDFFHIPLKRLRCNLDSVKFTSLKCVAQ